MEKISDDLINSMITRKILFHLLNYPNEITIRISRDVGCTYGTVVNRITQLLKLGLVKITKKDDRSNYVNLTKKGKEVTQKLNELKNLLKMDKIDLEENGK